jgi:hypothetical protein
LKIQILGTDFTRLAVSQLYSDLSPKLDLSIEGMRSQQFSEGVFAFLLVGIVVFIGIVIAFMFSKNRSEKMKLGERLMFTAIILGVAVAVIFGAMQMLGGYLF